MVNGGLRPGINIRGRTPWLDSRCRGEEIKAYLNEHPEIDEYIIVDDEDDLLPEQRQKFIQTDGYVGFGLRELELFEKKSNCGNKT